MFGKTASLVRLMCKSREATISWLHLVCVSRWWLQNRLHVWSRSQNKRLGGLHLKPLVKPPEEPCKTGPICWSKFAMILEPKRHVHKIYKPGYHQFVPLCYTVGWGLYTSILHHRHNSHVAIATLVGSPKEKRKLTSGTAIQTSSKRLHLVGKNTCKQPLQLIIKPS